MIVFNDAQANIKQTLKIVIPKNANKIICTLQNHGHTAYVVGGCVRDSIMGRVPHDWDICTSATPTEMKEIFKEEKVVETGLKHGTLTVVVNGEPFEITTYRVDGEYSDNRRPDSVLFTDSLIDDLRRRDFTINAIAFNEIDGLVDPFNGLSDIETGIIRCVGSPKERFEEDALRILRAIRFATRYDFQIEPLTVREIAKQYERLANISVERIVSELRQIIISPEFPFLLSSYDFLFSFLIPELTSLFKFPQNNPYHAYDAFEHTLRALENCYSDDLTVRLAVLFHDFGKPFCFQDDEDGTRHFRGHGEVSAKITDTIMKRLRFENKIREDVVQLVRCHDTTFEVSKKCVKRWLNKIGETQFRRLLLVREADIRGQSPNPAPERIQKIRNIEKVLEEILKEKECFSMKDLAINGSDLLEMGMEEGKEIGIILNSLLEKVMEGEMENKKEVLVRKVEKEMKKENG